LRLRAEVHVDEKATISGPVARPLSLVGLKQKFLVARTAGGLLIQVPGSASIGNEHDAAPILRPDGKKIFRRIEGKTRGNPPHKIEQPNIARTALWIGNGRSDLLFIW